jgi:hypothetical protein
VSDANRGSGYAGPTQADQGGPDPSRPDRGGEDAGGRSASPSSVQSPSTSASTGFGSNGSAGEEYATSTQVIPAVSPAAPGSPNGSSNGASNGSANGSPHGFSSPWGPYAGSTSPANGHSYYQSGPEAPTAADAPGDGLPQGEQPAPAVVPSWEPVASRPKKSLKDRWDEFTGKLSGRDAAEPTESDSAAAERVWASSAATGGLAAASSTEEAAASPVDTPTGSTGSTGSEGAAASDSGASASAVAPAAVSAPAVAPAVAPVEERPAGPSGASTDWRDSPVAPQTDGGPDPVAGELVASPMAREGGPQSPGSPELTEVSPWAPTAGPSTAVIAPVDAPLGPDYAPGYAQTPAAASKAKVGTPRRTRKARLRLSRLDPWSVMKTSFLFSIAAGIMLVVAVYVVWTVIGSSGLFDSVNDIIKSVVSTPNDTTPFRVEEYVNTQKVLGVAALLACVDVIIFTALATLGSFLYNLAATMLGGLEITLAED